MAKESLQGMVAHTIYKADRGERPAIRGWFHAGAAVASLICSTVISTYAWMTLPWTHALGVTVYAVCLVLLFGVSACYHLLPWRSAETVAWWRRADHATIAIFIAGTYTPMLLIAVPGARWLLVVAWAGAIAAAALNLVWINHPRALDVVIYLVLGWLVVPIIPKVWAQAGPAVVWLLFAGGIVYSLGALVYGFKWPGRNARWYGYHEHFHTATIVAAAVHMVAVWMVLTS